MSELLKSVSQYVYTPTISDPFLSSFILFVKLNPTPLSTHYKAEWQNGSCHQEKCKLWNFNLNETIVK